MGEELQGRRDCIAGRSHSSWIIFQDRNVGRVMSFFFLVAFPSVLAYVYLVSVSLSLLSVQYAPHHRSSTFLILSHTHHALHSMVFVYVARYEFVRVASHFSYPSINAPYKRCPGVIL